MNFILSLFFTQLLHLAACCQDHCIPVIPVHTNHVILYLTSTKKKKYNERANSTHQINKLPVLHARLKLNVILTQH